MYLREGGGWVGWGAWRKVWARKQDSNQVVVYRPGGGETNAGGKEDAEERRGSTVAGCEKAARQQGARRK